MNTSFGSLPRSGFGDLALHGDRTEGVLGSDSADGALGRYGAEGPLGLDAWRSTDDAGALHAQPSASARSLDDIERDFLAALCETRENRPA
jgi:hypothetical protein